MLPNEYGTPYPLEVNTLGREDGSYITRDGLTLYCFYAPMDLFSYVYSGGAADPCKVQPYLRGPFQEILQTVPPSLAGTCDYFLSSDILISHRNSTDEAFPAWSITAFSLPATFEGAPQLILNSQNPDLVDYMVFTFLNPEPSAGNGTSDIALFRSTTRNPAGGYEMLPAPVNSTTTTEDNPHLERINGGELLLYFVSHDRAGVVGGNDIFWSRSSDDGQSWSEPLPVNFNTTGDEDMPHIWQDGNGQYWLYYMDSDNEISRRQQQTADDWQNWGPATKVIGKDNAFAIGEPSLTQWGDIVFALVYDAGTGWGSDATNRYDNDMWVLPRKGSPFDK